MKIGVLKDLNTKSNKARKKLPLCFVLSEQPFDIPTEFQRFINGDNFLQFNSGKIDENRMLRRPQCVDKM